MNPGLDPLDVRYQVTSTTRLSTTKYDPWLPPPAISVIATASEEHENHNDNQNGCHSFLQNIHREASLLYMVRNNYVTSFGIYLVLPVASGWFVAIRRCAHHRVLARLVFRTSTSTRRRGGLAEMIGRGGFFMHGFGTLGLIEYNGKFYD